MTACALKNDSKTQLSLTMGTSIFELAKLVKNLVNFADQRPKTKKPKIFPSNQNIIASENKVSFNAVIGSNITILEGKNLVLQCPTTGLPTPKVTWYFNNKAVVTSETLIVNPKTGELTVIEMMKEETGVYTCESKNIAGQDRAFTFAIVVGKMAFIYYLFIIYLFIIIYILFIYLLYLFVCV